jgi:DNA transformation protein
MRRMKSNSLKQISKLEDLPNIGSHIANDLRAIGINSPADLRRRVPLTTFNELKDTMGHRHDPCVFYTLLSVEHYFATSESLPWWRFTAIGKTQLNKQRTKKNP